MLTTSESVPEEERIEIVDTFIDRLVVSGYCVSQIKEIIESGLQGYLKTSCFNTERETKEEAYREDILVQEEATDKQHKETERRKNEETERETETNSYCHVCSKDSWWETCQTVERC